jgi:hypothetical protein
MIEAETLEAATARLEIAEKMLRKIGVVDVKFAWGDVEKVTLAEATSATASALEAVIAHEQGTTRLKKFEGLNDSYGLRPRSPRVSRTDSQPKPR